MYKAFTFIIDVMAYPHRWAIFELRAIFSQILKYSWEYYGDN